MTTQSPAALPDIDVLEAFMVFPAPLALLDSEGRTTLVNSRFLARFARNGLDAATLRALAHDPDGVWQNIRQLPRDATQAELRARAIRTSHRILLIVDDPDAGERHDDVEALRARIDDLERIAVTDHLTGAWNRAHLERVLEAELARSAASRQPLSLILFDIDHFKNINDTHGHAVGDIVLRELVQLVRNRIRASDLLFRWGGEEFVVLASSVGYRRAEGIAENLRQMVASHSFKGAGSVTVSLGVAEHDGDEDADTWFRRMDEALYEAKRSGRNRSVVARRGNSDTWAAEGGACALHLVWQEGYECGDPTIDAEHRELFRLANKLMEASLQEQPKPGVMNALLAEFLAHVQRHFSDEEAILSRLHYDGLSQHQRAHAGLIQRARRMADRFEAGDGSVSELVEFLAQDVVARHLIAVDRAFFPLFAATPRTR